MENDTDLKAAREAFISGNPLSIQVRLLILLEFSRAIVLSVLDTWRGQVSIWDNGRNVHTCELRAPSGAQVAIFHREGDGRVGKDEARQAAADWIVAQARGSHITTDGYDLLSKAER